MDWHSGETDCCFHCCTEWIYSSAHRSQEEQNRHCINLVETRHGSWCHYTGNRVFSIALVCVVSVFGSKERPTCRNGIFGVLPGMKNGAGAKKRKIGSVILCSPNLNRTETLATQARIAHSNRLPDRDKHAWSLCLFFCRVYMHFLINLRLKALCY